MSNLPVKRMVLYKHGVGFFERLGSTGNSTQVELTFKKEEMNDVLKSLAAFPQGGAQVVNISYETPEDKQSALGKAPIVLSADQALLDLLKSLRGRAVRLHLTDVESSLPELQGVHTAEDEVAIAGTLIGIDRVPSHGQTTEFPLADTLVSLQTSGTEPDSHPALRTYKLGQVRGVDILDDQSGDDLRYVLKLSRANADKRSVTILLNRPNQELLVSYIAPTPTWRVSYRLVYTPEPVNECEASTSPSAHGKLLLQGWGIVDNQLDEDLDQVALTLIAGQPISFVYDLYTPRLINRPTVKDEERVVAGPVMFDEALSAEPLPPNSFEEQSAMMAMAAGSAAMDFSDPMPTRPAPRSAGRMRKKAVRRDMETATQMTTEGTAKGEFFQYDVGNPVTIKRGQSAMVPIIGATLEGQKSHIYNAEKVPNHPVVTLMAKNTSGLTLERGPVTVLETHNYVGEAVLAFTPNDGEFFVPYAVDLGVKVTEHRRAETKTAAIRLGQGYLIHDQYHMTIMDYEIENRNPEPIQLTIEQRIQHNYTLFDTPEPTAKTAEFYRWSLPISARASHSFTVRERRIVSHHETLQDWSDRTLQSYFRNQFIDRALFDRLHAILDLYQAMAKEQRECDRLVQKREKQLQEQTQTAQKLEHLANGGEEGKLRQRFVTKMGDLEDESDRILQTIQTLEARQRELQAQIDEALNRLTVT